MNINYKSLPVYANRKEVKQKLETAKKEYDNYAYDLKLDQHTTLVMELNYHTVKWDCVAVYMNGYKVS